jgi:glycosyltransferase involved in cell wall biosynthesis
LTISTTLTVSGRIFGNKRAGAYVIVTPARNEAAFIELTIQSVISQTVLPLKWVIVSDGSTDGTDDIVGKYAAQFGWIELVRMPERQERHFAGKVLAFNAGFARVKDLDYEFIASLDADITFDSEYFSFLLGKFAEDSRLGLVGTPFREGDKSYDYRFVSIEHVSGACQLFRRRCFADIGGFVPVKGGGVDHVAVITSRMKGWRTRTFTEKTCEHHRVMGAAKHGPVKMKFQIGKLDYALGGHPLWELFRTAYQMTQKPLVIGGLMIFTGYFWSAIRREPRPVSAELVKFRRREQMQRLTKFVTGRQSAGAAGAEAGNAR